MASFLTRTHPLAPPMNGAGLNWAHPLSRGLVFFPLFAGGQPQCLVNRTAPTAVGSLKIGPMGGSFNPSNNSTNNSWFEWSQSWVASTFASKTSITLALAIRATGSNAQGSMMSIANSSGSAYTIIGNLIGWYPNSGASVTISGVSAYQTGVTYLYVCTGDATACRGTIWINGGLAGDSGATAALGTLNAALVRVRVGDERGSTTGGPSVGSFSPYGEVFYAAAWNRVMPMTEMAQLAANPYAMVNDRGLAPVGINSTAGRWGVTTGVGIG